MFRAFMIGAVSAVALMLSTGSFAQQSQPGTAQDAQGMLTKTVAALKADKTNTIAMINKGEGGFLQGDIYPFGFQTTDGKVVATAPQLQKFVGTDIRTLKDPTGKAFGPEIFAAAKEGKITEVGGYQFPKPGTDTPVPKVSFVTLAIWVAASATTSRSLSRSAILLTTRYLAEPLRSS